MSNPEVHPARTARWITMMAKENHELNLLLDDLLYAAKNVVHQDLKPEYEGKYKTLREYIAGLGYALRKIEDNR
jgi:hypothetical protein